jgi:hypothetical protein
MKRTKSIAAVLALSGSCVGLAWMASRADRAELAAELDSAPTRAADARAPRDDSVELPIPEADPGLSGNSPALAAEALGRHRTVVPAPKLDFEAVYRDWPSAKLPERIAELEASVELAKAARFDALQAKFDELYAKRQFGARVTELGRAFDGVEWKLGRKQAYSARTVELPNGNFVMHVLEFCPAEDPATAPLVAELDWVRARLQR